MTNSWPILFCLHPPTPYTPFPTKHPDYLEAKPDSYLPKEKFNSFKYGYICWGSWARNELRGESFTDVTFRTPVSLGKRPFIWERLGVCHLPSACLTLPTGDSSFSPRGWSQKWALHCRKLMVGNELTQPAALELWHWARAQNNKKVLLTCCIWTLSTNESLLCSNTRTLILCLIKISHHFSESNRKVSK